jgi:hypothetical protein
MVVEVVAPHGTGYAWKHPDALAAATNLKNWTFTTLLAGTTVVPYQQLPDFDWDCGPTLNQGSEPACTRFGVTAVRNYQELLDEGSAPFTSAEALQSYKYLKWGDPSGVWPGDGIPYAGGDIPLNVWKYEQLIGSVGPDGKNRKIGPYYQLDKTPSDTDQSWLDEFFNVMHDFGPVTVSSAWPTNWFPDPAPSGVMPNPSGATAGHMWAVKGKKTINGVIYARCRQSWGDGWGVVDTHGHGGEFLIPVAQFALVYILGLAECWKTVDILGDHPTPLPEVGMLPVYSIAPAYVDLAIGVQCFKEDGKTPLVKVSSGGAGRFSPGLAYAGQRAVEINTGGIRQYAVINSVNCTNVRPFAPVPVAHAAVLTLDGVPKLSGSITY